MLIAIVLKLIVEAIRIQQLVLRLERVVIVIGKLGGLVSKRQPFLLFDHLSWLRNGRHDALIWFIVLGLEHGSLGDLLDQIEFQLRVCCLRQQP